MEKQMCGARADLQETECCIEYDDEGFIQNGSWQRSSICLVREGLAGGTFMTLNVLITLKFFINVHDSLK